MLPLGHSRPTNYNKIDASDVQTSLVQVSHLKDLGVWLTNLLTSTLQCQKAVNKPMQVMETKILKYLTKESFSSLYNSLIQPHLDHCIPSWSPYLAQVIDLLKKIQHCAPSWSVIFHHLHMLIVLGVFASIHCVA